MTAGGAGHRKFFFHIRFLSVTAYRGIRRERLQKMFKNIPGFPDELP
jgi:hypothetical protein